MPLILKNKDTIIYKDFNFRCSIGKKGKTKNKIEDIIICTGHLSEKIDEYVGNGARFELNVKYSNDGKKLLGTGG